MNPAAWPRDDGSRERLLVVDVATGTLTHARVADLVDEIGAGDVVVVNDAATLPASVPFTFRGARGELRVAGVESATRCRAILFGEPPAPRAQTEDYGPALALAVGDEITIAGDARAAVIEVDPTHARLVRLAFDAPMLPALQRAGSPVQYAHVRAKLSLFHVQTAFATRPWAVEMPSAARPLSVGMVIGMRRRGAEVVGLTHAAGLSSTGDPTLDARLPLRERYDIPFGTADAVQRARARGGRIVAIGTSVVRALEGSAESHGGVVTGGEGSTELLVGRRRPPRVVDAILSGMHRPGTSHFDLLEGFTDADAQTGLTARAFEEGEASGYQEHEFGDSIFVRGLPRATGGAARAAA